MKELMRLIAALLCLFMVFNLSACKGDKTNVAKYNNYFEITDFVYDKSNVTTSKINNSALLSGFTKIKESGVLCLYINAQTGNVAVEDKRSGKVWSSVPFDIENDKVATEDMREIMKSQMTVSYYSQDTLKVLYSYTNSLLEDGFSYENTENGMRIKYSMSLGKLKYEDLPSHLSDKRFKEFFSDNPELTDTERNRVKKYYTWNKSKKAWVLGKETSTMVRVLPQIMKKVGYTTEELKRDNEEFGIDYKPTAQIFFDIVIDYILNGDSLVVDVPLSELKYNPEYPPITIEIDPLMLHSSNTADGYMLVPDGSGAIVDFSKSDGDTGGYELNIYSNDKTISNQETSLKEITTVMPVYGIKEKNNGILAIVEDGDAMARVSVKKSGTSNQYNTVGAIYTLMNNTNATIGDGSANTTIPVYQDKLYGGSIRTRYVFLSDNATYSDMAKCFKAYWMKNENLKLNKVSDNAEMYIETLGAITRTKEFLGIQYEGMEKLTTFQEAEKILKKYNDEGIENINVISFGAVKGGIDNYSLNKNGVLSSLGGNKGWESLQKSVAKQNGKLYLEVKAITVPKESGNINRTKNSARTIDQSIAKRYDYNLITGEKTGINNILSISYLPEYINSFISSLSKDKVNNFAFNDFGSELYTDYNKENTYLRQSSKRLIKDTVKSISNKNGIILNEPMLDVMPYADALIRVPLYSNNSKLISRSVPFLELVLSGVVSYTGEAYNEVGDRKYQLLKTVETGASSLFSLFYADNTVLLRSEYTYLTSNNYMLFFDESVKIMKELQDIRSKVGGSYIVEHKELKKNIYATVYENGWSVITNYSKQEEIIDGNTVPPMNYIVTRESEN